MPFSTITKINIILITSKQIGTYFYKNKNYQRIMVKRYWRHNSNSPSYLGIRGDLMRKRG